MNQVNMQPVSELFVWLSVWTIFVKVFGHTDVRMSIYVVSTIWSRQVAHVCLINRDSASSTDLILSDAIELFPHILCDLILKHSFLACAKYQAERRNATQVKRLSTISSQCGSTKKRPDAIIEQTSKHIIASQRRFGDRLISISLNIIRLPGHISSTAVTVLTSFKHQINIHLSIYSKERIDFFLIINSYIFSWMKLILNFQKPNQN